MKKDNLTLILDGQQVSIDDFARAVSGLNRLIKNLTLAIAGKQSQIEWVVTDLEYGSASTTITGYSEHSQAVYGVVEGYYTVGRALQQGSEIPYNQRVRDSAYAMTDILGDRVSSIIFETPEDQAVVRPAEKVGKAPTTHVAFGAIEGRIQTLSDRKGVRFILYDSLNDKPISCYLEENRREELVNKWGRRAIVQGMITRDALSNRALAIRNITNIEILPEVRQGAFREARGIVKLEEPSDVFIRRLRDA